ncbi:MAG: integrin alpha [Phycisphaerales bacterium]
MDTGTRLAISLGGAVAVLGGTAPRAVGQCVEGCVAIHTFAGENAGDTFGWVSENTGDIDKDGVDDLIVSAIGFGANHGRVYVYSGATGDLLFPPITGSVAGWQLGSSVGAAGDVNNDGTLDVIVGATGVGAGRAFVYSGVDGSVLRTFLGDVSGDLFGYAVTGIGDINRDGCADLLVTAIQHDAAGTNSGRAYVYSGLDSSIMGTVDGETSFDLFGSGAALIGDVTNDNINDFVIGARNAVSGNGRAYVYSGADFLKKGPIKPVHVLLPPGPAADFGWFFLDGGDMNADGTPDIYVTDFSANRAHVFSGIDGGLLRTFTGTGGFGIGRFVGDINGDDHEDLILASWVHNAGGTQAGRAEIFDGATGKVLDTYTHNVPFAQFGFDANGMGDVDGDGKTDYLITAANDSGGTGKAYLIAGNIGPPAIPGDLDGDGSVGASDLLILLVNWGPCADCDDCPADLDDDCSVGAADLLILLVNWG